MNKTSILIALALMTASCAATPRSEAIVGSPSRYFPDTTFDETIDDVFFDGKDYRGWYSNHLAALQERSLFEMDGGAEEIYFRFVWLRTFHNPVAIKVELTRENTATLTFKLADGAGGYDAGKLVKVEEKDLDKPQIERIQSLFDAINICDEPPDESAGFDGAQWIFERRDTSTYCVVHRWTPQSGPYWDLGRYFLELAEFVETKDQPIY